MTDTSTLYTAWPDTEAVAYISMDRGRRRINVANAKRQSISRKEAAELGMIMTSATLTWSLPIAQMDGVTPKGGDVIQDENGVRWTVKDGAEYLGRGSRWRVIAVQER